MNNKVTIINILKIAGAWLSYCIGSGFATGQSNLQYFANHGVYAFGAIGIMILFSSYIASSHLTVGLEKQFKNPILIFDYYCGSKVGKVLAVLTIIYSFFGTAVMIAGFGATLEQLYGINPIIGNALLGLIIILTLVLGLNKVTNILGSVGPFLIVVSILAAILFTATHFENLSEGMKLAPELDIISIGDNWFTSGALDALWAPVCCAPFLALTATTVNSKTEVIAGGILGAVMLGVAEATISIALFCDIEAASQTMIPTMYIASKLSPIFSVGFGLVIILGIYSSAVPNLFTVCATFAKEKSKRFYLLAVICPIIAVTGTLFLPFDKLMNVIYTIFGYLGVPAIIVMLYTQIKNYYRKKKVNEA